MNALLIFMKELIKALQILNKYDNPSNPTHCEHDELWVLVNPSLVTYSDKEQLGKLGFRADGDHFISYKYGSA